ncbi:hypothetical protein MMC18_009186 [Xylographa bjoerkii]|nr:hypothetical protein [Xylographa bjoerkii]
MPPKKKARLSSRAASTLSAETPAETMSAADDKATPAREDQSPVKDLSPAKDLLADPWTDEQEISLFKGMVKWKPVGIWEKLGSLYNLKILDEREDSFGELIPEDNDPRKEPFVPFGLPGNDFGDLMFERRLASPGSSSPPSLPDQLLDGNQNVRRRPSVVDDSEEPRSSPASTRGMKSTRGRRGNRRSLLKSTARGRRPSKASVEASGEGEEQEDEDDDDEDEDESDEESTPSSSARGGRGANRPGRGGRWGRWRGRGGRRGGRKK